MEPLRIAALQLDLEWKNPEANRRRIARMISGIKGEVDLILLPEMFTTGFTMDVEELWEPPDGKTQQWMQKLARNHRALIGGSLIIREDYDYFNRFLLVNSKGVEAEYDKRHLFRMAKEDDYFESGREWVIFGFKGWQICPQICYDLRFPVWARNRLLSTNSPGYDLLIFVANWPAARSSHWKALLRARAIENQAYVIGLNRVGKDGKGITYAGDSVILGPKGEELAVAGDESTVLTASLELQPLQAYREKFPAWRDAENFDIFL